MFTPRDLATVQADIISAFSHSNVPADFSEGSIFTALIRSFAAAQVEEDLRLQGLVNNLFLSTAQGEALDLKAADLDRRLVRKKGLFATGSVLVQSDQDAFILPIGAALTEPASGLQVEVVGVNAYPISPFAQTAVPVQALVRTELANFSAGTQLISPTFPQGTFIVGTHRTTAGAYCGDLTGGTSPETDAQFRTRILVFINTRSSANESAIKSAILTQTDVSWAALRVPYPGICEVWVDSESTLLPSELENLFMIASDVKPAGVIISVGQAARTYTDVNVYIKPKAHIDLQALTDLLVAQVHTFLMTLGLGQVFTPTKLQSYLLAQSGVSSSVISLQVLKPSVAVTPTSTGVVRSEKVWITYDTV